MLPSTCTVKTLNISVNNVSLFPSPSSSSNDDSGLTFANFSELYVPDGYFTQRDVKQALETKLIPALCLIGILGNVLNLLVLGRLARRSSDRLPHVGLTALALSDLLFCASTLPHALRDRRSFSSSTVDAGLLYAIYGEAVINTFVLCSTWLTVVLAVLRYRAVYHPSRAEPSPVALVVCVFVVSVLFNMPRFWLRAVASVECLEGGRSYFSVSGPMRTLPAAEITYMWFYFVLGIAVPLVTLSFCNLHLVRALRRSAGTHEQRRDDAASAIARHLVTLTLSVIVAFFVLLVGPAEVLNFGRYFIKSRFSLRMSIGYSVAVAVGNTMQAVNFSFNFLLYCVINRHFRRELAQLIPGCCRRTTAHPSSRTPEVQLLQPRCNGRAGNAR